MGLSLSLAFAAPLFLGFPPPGGLSFSEAWYREAVLGEELVAGELFQRIYEDAGAGASRPGTPLEVRRKAALRAGLCFEKVGEHRRARAAYSWLERTGPPEDRRVREARFRLLDLPGEVSEQRGAYGARVAAGPTSGAESNPVLGFLEARVAQRETCREAENARLHRLEEQAGAEGRLRRRLSELGVEVRFERRPPEEEEEGFGRALDPKDRELFEEELAERYYLRGLRALRDRDPARAVEELRKSLSLRPGHRDAPDLLRAALGFLEPMEGIAERAALRLAERHEAREAEAPPRLRAALATAEKLFAEEHVAEALNELERARSKEEWTRPAAGRLTETWALAREVDLRVLLASAADPSAAAQAAVVQRYEELRARGRRATQEILATAEKLTDLRAVSGDLRPVRAAAAGPAIEKEQRETTRRITGELERLLALGEDRHRRSPQDTGPDGFKREFRDLLILLDWFPELDGDRRFRKLAQDYLAR